MEMGADEATFTKMEPGSNVSKNNEAPKISNDSKTESRKGKALAESAVTEEKIAKISKSNPNSAPAAGVSVRIQDEEELSIDITLNTVKATQPPAKKAVPERAEVSIENTAIPTATSSTSRDHKDNHKDKHKESDSGIRLNTHDSDELSQNSDRHYSSHHRGGRTPPEGYRGDDYRKYRGSTCQSPSGDSSDDDADVYNIDRKKCGRRRRSLHNENQRQQNNTIGSNSSGADFRNCDPETSSRFQDGANERQFNNSISHTSSPRNSGIHNFHDTPTTPKHSPLFSYSPNKKRKRADHSSLSERISSHVSNKENHVQKEITCRTDYAAMFTQLKQNRQQLLSPPVPKLKKTQPSLFSTLSVIDTPCPASPEIEVIDLSHEDSIDEACTSDITEIHNAECTRVKLPKIRMAWGLPKTTMAWSLPKKALTIWYERRYGKDTFRPGECIISWDDRYEPHGHFFTSVVICPVSGEKFGCGTYGIPDGIREKEEASITGESTTVIWYACKKDAEQAAAARALDCLSYREGNTHGIMKQEITPPIGEPFLGCVWYKKDDMQESEPCVQAKALGCFSYGDGKNYGLCKEDPCIDIDVTYLVPSSAPGLIKDQLMKHH